MCQNKSSGVVGLMGAGLRGMTKLVDTASDNLTKMGKDVVDATAGTDFFSAIIKTVFPPMNT